MPPSSVSAGSNDYGAAIVITSYALVGVSAGVGGLRLYHAIRWKKEFRFDDVLFLSAIVLALAQSILVDRSVRQGLGQRIDTLSASRIDASYKWIYASQILGFVIQVLTKLSLNLLVARLHSRPIIATQCSVFTAVAICWGFFATFAIAFQCGTRAPWDFTNGHCLADGKLWYPILVLDVVTDAYLMAFSLPVAWKLPVPNTTHCRMTTLFGSRLLVCGVILGHISVLGNYLDKADKTWYNSIPTILYQITINLSLITSGIPSLCHRLPDSTTSHPGSIPTEPGLQLTSVRTDRSAPSSGAALSKSSSGLSSHLNSAARMFKDHSSRPQTASSRSDEEPLRLFPYGPSEFSTHISTGNSDERPKSSVSTLICSSDVFSPEVSSLRALAKGGVVQRREVTVEFEDNPDRYRNFPYCGQYLRIESLHA